MVKVSRYLLVGRDTIECNLGHWIVVLRYTRKIDGDYSLDYSLASYGFYYSLDC